MPQQPTTTSETEAYIHALFDSWGSGDPDQVEPFFDDDTLLWDSVNGEFRGWPAIRSLYEASLERWHDLTTVATRFWHGVDGSVAFTWTMSGRVADDRFGPGFRGKTCSFDGMSYVTIQDGRVREEIEYFDRAAPAASIGLAPTVTFTTR